MSENRIKGTFFLYTGIAIMVISACFIMFVITDAGFLQGTLIADYRTFFKYAGSFVLLYGSLATYVGRQYLAKEKKIEQIPGGSEKPILYLRSFATDNTLKANATNGILRFDPTLETQIKTATKSLGPLIAIGDPNEDMPAPDAIRSNYSNEDWKIKFKQYASEAQLIVLSAGLSENVMWELSELLTLNLKDKLVLHLSLNQQELDLFFLGLITRHPDLDYDVPAKINNPALLYFNNNTLTYFKPPNRLQFALSANVNAGYHYILRSYLEKFKGVRKQSYLKSFFITIVIVLGITILFMILADPSILELFTG